MVWFPNAIYKQKVRLRLFVTCLMFWFPCFMHGQQIEWARLYPLQKSDGIRALTQDESGNMYAVGSTMRGVVSPGGDIYERGMVIKLTPEGDTVFIRYLEYGIVYSAAVDKSGIVRLNYVSNSLQTSGYMRHILVQMTQDGFIFQRDTIPLRAGFLPWSCMIGKDSSLIIVGQVPRTGAASQNSMFFQRVQKDGQIDPWVELNPGHPNCVANRVEQLSNGHYMVSGYVGSRIASYELDEWGLTYTFKQWYQTPDFSNMNSGYVSRINGQRYMIGGAGGPCLVGQFDSLLNKYWLRKDVGTQVPPQAIVDGSVIFGYVGPTQSNTLYRVRADSSEFWKITIKDSLAARGINGVMRVNCFSYFDDESAVVAGVMSRDAPYNEDPIFLRIANVGTPVTSLSKPKPGPLKNETLAPWPNPTGGTLFLKQHFDKAEVHFYNISGKEVGQYNIHFGQPIDVSAFPSGVYLYRAVIDGKAFSGKIIKQ